MEAVFSKMKGKYLSEELFNTKEDKQYLQLSKAGINRIIINYSSVTPLHMY